MIVLAIDPVPAMLCVTRQPCPREDFRGSASSCVVLGCSTCRGQRHVGHYKRLISLSERDAGRVRVGARVVIAATKKAPDVVQRGIGLTGKEGGAGYVMDLHPNLGGGRLDLPLGAIVGSAVVEAVVPIVDGDECRASVTDPYPPHLCLGWERLRLIRSATDGVDLSDQLAYDTGLTPGRWAVLLTDAAPTSERCPWCNGEARRFEGNGRWRECHQCEGSGACPSIPYTATGRVGTWT